MKSSPWKGLSKKVAYDIDRFLMLAVSCLVKEELPELLSFSSAPYYHWTATYTMLQYIVFPWLCKGLLIRQLAGTYKGCWSDKMSHFCLTRLYNATARVQLYAYTRNNLILFVNCYHILDHRPRLMQPIVPWGIQDKLPRILSLLFELRECQPRLKETWLLG